MFDYLDIAALALIPGFMALDLVHQARRYTRPRLWRLNGLLISGLTVYLSFQIPKVWDAWLGSWSLFDFSNVGPWAGAGVGMVIYETGHYAYHRLVHGVDWMWRSAHQMHHAAESLDAFGAYFLHPLDTFMFTSIATLVTVNLLGLSLESALLVNFWLVFNAMFQHANIRTPRWIGYLIQRPESHALHHMRGVHRFNYSDLPLVDMVFGTFRNPESQDEAVGFYDGASSRWFEMAAAQDLTSPPPATQAAVTAKTLPQLNGVGSWRPDRHALRPEETQS
jgi:sterol desaturase/sphingolipid hydroxylase (fatty acid hydroxylase superfamily)